MRRFEDRERPPIADEPLRSAHRARPTFHRPPHSARSAGLVNVVAEHYNRLEENGFEERKASRIFHMRQLNNWIKSCFITNTVHSIKSQKRSPDIQVLDLACGKGGDLMKWQKANVGHVVFADIARRSIEQCEQRYKNMAHNNKNTFTSEFIVADCFNVRIKDKMNNPNINFDLVSCQFALHYSFESQSQVEQMLANVSSNLVPGGLFIGTTVDSESIIKRLSTAGHRKFGNELYSVEFPAETYLKPQSLFGTGYHFHLDQVVDCTEFLVHFLTLENLASRYGLKLEMKQSFPDFISQQLEHGNDLLHMVNAAETWPVGSARNLAAKFVTDYSQADDVMKLHKIGLDRIGTLSESEWEVVSLYLVFVFRKVSDRIN